MASKRNLRRKGCTNKRAFESKDAAMAAMFALKRNKRAAGLVGYMDVYHCEFGNHFHFGHPRHTNQKKRRKDFV